MKVSLLKRLGFTLIELLVVISIIGILASLAIPAVTGALVRGQMTGQLSNMKQLHLVTQSMALDRTTTGDTKIGWPADIGGGWKGWVDAILNYNYMTTNDFAKMISGPGAVVSTDEIASSAGKSAVLVYNVGETTDNSFVFLTSANFDPKELKLSATSAPFGNKGFVVMRKGGDGVILSERQATNTNLIGGLTDRLE